MLIKRFDAMNVIRIYGGLGNQLFQYAFGRAQEENGIEVRYEDSWYHRKQPRKYPRPCVLNKLHTHVQYSPFLNQTLVKQTTGYSLDLLKKENANFDGYWQYLPYFKDILPILRKEFIVKEEFHTPQFLQLKKEIETCPSVSIHVRRGDYLTHGGVFRNLKFEYYYNALKGNTGDLFIFSDDIPWCKEMFTQDYFSNRITFVDLHDYLSFELMKLCKEHIVSNSTYSYWAALLSGNSTKCPQHWLGEQEIDTKELQYPKEWVKMEDYVIY